MGMDCAPLLADLFLYTYDDILSLNNSRFGDYLHLIYPNELEEKATPDTQVCFLL